MSDEEVNGFLSVVKGALETRRKLIAARELSDRLKKDADKIAARIEGAHGDDFIYCDDLSADSIAILVHTDQWTQRDTKLYFPGVPVPLEIKKRKKPVAVPVVVDEERAVKQKMLDALIEKRENEANSARIEILTEQIEELETELNNMP